MQQDRRRKSSKEVEFFTAYGKTNRYKVLEIIGKGSYGVVCAALDTQTSEKVAIKKITNIFEHTSDAIRILREVKLLRLLRHPDIVEIKCILMPPSSRDFKDIYVVFELMESDLHQVIKANDDLTHEHHRFFLYQMLRALKYMHTGNVYHRDLKPKNILANANCKIKICDFGLARAAFTDTPTTIFWTDYVATRWYRAPELCGSFYSKVLEWIYSILLEVEFSSLQYTTAIDIWGIGCIFAEVLTGKPLFPGKSVVHQLELITDLLGTPSSDTLSKIRNEKAKKYLTNMRRKKPISFSEKFIKADPLSLKLLQRLLAFDPKDRPTAEEALSDPYFNGLSKLEREPSCRAFSKLEFEFERRRVSKEDIRELIFREILEYHPQFLKDHSNFLYPSAISQIRREFAYFEENVENSGPVIPLERKHVSLPRSAVSSTMATFDNRLTADNMSHGDTRLPPTIPEGRVAGPVERSRNMKGVYDPRIKVRNTNTVGLSPHYVYHARGQQKSTDSKLSPGLVNSNLFYKQAHGQPKSSELIPIDAKFVQAQSRREVGVHMG